ncbi:MAG: lipid-binding SYLF domain-containing protein [Planctomycetota bacterium]|jgi:lipid-binding SYLF domain-containing protein
MARLLLTLMIISLVTLGLGACTSAESMTGSDARAEMDENVTTAMAFFRRADPGIEDRLKSAYGYAIFPTVAKGGLIVGGAHGNGQVYRGGKAVGATTLTQASIGAQIGGQGYRELILFEDQAAFQSFTSGSFEFAGQASAIAAKSGASANAAYDGGVMVFTQPKAGLMAEASVGGQKFAYVAFE